MALAYIDKSALDAIVNDLSSPAKAIAETVIHNHGMTNWMHRDRSPEIRTIAMQCEQHGLFEDAGKIYEKQGNLPDAIKAYDTGKMYHRAGLLSITEGQSAQAEEFARKLETEKPEEALDLYKKLCDSDGIKRMAPVVELKDPYEAARGYLSIGFKPEATRCADTLESMEKKDPTNMELKKKVAYIRMHVGDHESAAEIYRKVGIDNLADSLMRTSTQTTAYSPGVVIRGVPFMNYKIRDQNDNY